MARAGIAVGLLEGQPCLRPWAQLFCPHNLPATEPELSQDQWPFSVAFAWVFGGSGPRSLGSHPAV